MQGAGVDLAPQHGPLTDLCREIERETNDLRRQLAEQTERAEYAWRNTRTIEAARAEEMRKRDAAEAQSKEILALLRDLVATIDLHTDCMTGTIDRDVLDPYIDQAERL